MQTNYSFHLMTICGGSASGKSTILNELRRLFTPDILCIISFDDYYKPLEKQVNDEFGITNFDLPGSVDLRQLLVDLELLSQGKQLTRYEYTFGNPYKKPEKKVINPAPLVIVEGLFVFYFEELRKRSDYKVLVTAAEKIRYARRKKRDINDRAIAEDLFEHQWKYHVKPAYDKYILPFEKEANLVIENDTDYRDDFGHLTQHISQQLEL